MSDLSNYRKVTCPTCNAGPGNYCVSVGARGKEAGHTMTTSCHNGRMVAAGYPARHTLSERAAQAAKKGGQGNHGGRSAAVRKKQSEGMKASWKRRKAQQQTDNKLQMLAPTTWQLPMTITRLLTETLALLQTGAQQVTLALEGVGEVKGHTNDANFYTLLVKR